MAYRRNRFFTSIRAQKKIIDKNAGIPEVSLKLFQLFSYRCRNFLLPTNDAIDSLIKITH